MSLPIKLGLFLATSIVLSFAISLYRALRRSDFMMFTLFGRHFAIDNPFPVSSDIDHLMINALYIRPINEFLFEFARSSEKAIQITPDNISANSVSSPLLRALRELDYEKIRLRLRVISNLNPVINLKAEEATIRFSHRINTDTEQEFEIRSIFAPK